MTNDLLRLRDWLAAERITTVGIEATGAYWKPVYYLLEDDFDTMLLTPGICTTCRGARAM